MSVFTAILNFKFTFQNPSSLDWTDLKSGLFSIYLIPLKITFLHWPILFNLPVANFILTWLNHTYPPIPITPYATNMSTVNPNVSCNMFNAIPILRRCCLYPAYGIWILSRTTISMQTKIYTVTELLPFACVCPISTYTFPIHPSVQVYFKCCKCTYLCSFLPRLARCTYRPVWKKLPFSSPLNLSRLNKSLPF